MLRMKHTCGIFTVIHISYDHLLSDHFALDPKSHVHNEHIHTIVVHTNHTHTSFVHITRARCRVVLSTSELGPAHHRCPYLSSSFFLPLPRHESLLIPSLMSTMMTSIQLSSIPMTSTHPLSTSRELDVVVLSTPEFRPAHHRLP
ncbi:hypothetical protein HID58_044459 [Brassica napus]|uniref:Uncharacterized protein n=1 Tax=Brassica napus TaxID=3708 RepID=A0ABQ8BL89_BRANA|nr:hypothetical protein HID58_044459 [Brassica napus]